MLSIYETNSSNVLVLSSTGRPYADKRINISLGRRGLNLLSIFLTTFGKTKNHLFIQVLSSPKYVLAQASTSGVFEKKSLSVLLPVFLAIVTSSSGVN